MAALAYIVDDFAAGAPGRARQAMVSAEAPTPWQTLGAWRPSF
jgi:hypothetical protein